MYVYIQTEPRLYTAGFYDPQGKWHPESDHNTKQAAFERVHYLNGGGSAANLLKQLVATYNMLIEVAPLNLKGDPRLAELFAANDALLAKFR